MKAITLVPIGRIPADSIIMVVDRRRGELELRYKQITEKVDAGVPTQHLFVYIPDAHDIRRLLRKVASFQIHWHSDDDKYRIAGLRFGKLTRISVPVFDDHQVINQRMVTTTRHVDFTADSEESLLRMFFRAAVPGKLYAHFPGGRLEQLYWDSEFQEFSTRVVAKPE